MIYKNDEQAKKSLLKIKDKYKDKVIKKGYSKGNKSLGMLNDLNRAFVGYQTPLDGKIFNTTKVST